jgi:DNA-binding NarL/FixJ family response regulator
MSAKKRVLIVEDNRLLREGLKAILSDCSDIEIAGEACDGIEAVKKAKRLQPDLILLDLSMPRMNGFSVLQELKAYIPDIRILVITIHESEKYIREAFSAGADGYCIKNDSRQELLIAIHSTLAGKLYISPSIARAVLDGFLVKPVENGIETDWKKITQREKEILKLLAEGYTNKEISGMLYISVKTVEKHRANIMSKLKLHNVPKLTTLAIEKGLVEIKS